MNLNENQRNPGKILWIMMPQYYMKVIESQEKKLWWRNKDAVNLYDSKKCQIISLWI